MPTRLPWWLEGLLLINYTAIRQKLQYQVCACRKDMLRMTISVFAPQ